MKKIISFIFIAMLVLCAGCGEKVEHVQAVSHKYFDEASITVPSESSNFAKALYEATDMTVNEVVNTLVKAKPEFISFEFSSDVMLSRAEKDTLLSLFSVYGVEITEGLRSNLEDVDRGISVSYGSIEATQTSDCDLTLPVKVYYGKSFYTYCCDFNLYNGEYVLFRFEQLSRTRYLF